MQTAFDQIALSYDEQFTNTVIGKKQREIVWNYLEGVLHSDVHLNILELNSGTGEDAIYFAQKGHNVTATDSSDEMINVTNKKNNDYSLEEKISVRKLDIKELGNAKFDPKYDLIFSNFGGINCVDKNVLESLSKICKRILNEGGRVMLVIMPKFCLWESIYFLLRFKFKSAFRRLSSKPIKAHLNNKEVYTYYYSPGMIRKYFEDEYVIRKITPVGFFIPPSYLNRFFSKKYQTFKLLCKLEAAVTNISFLAYASDHFLIDMELKA